MGKTANLSSPRKRGSRATRRAAEPGGDTTCGGPWIPAFAGMTGVVVASTLSRRETS